jgi:hypothetical protein
LGVKITVAEELEQKVQQRTREIQELKDQLQRENVALREEVDAASMFEEIVGAPSGHQAQRPSAACRPPRRNRKSAR